MNIVDNTKTLDENIISKKVLILNQSYEPLAIIPVSKAFILVWLDKADVIEVYENEFLRSVTQVFECPSVIRLKKYSKIPFRRVELNKKNVHKRDGNKCAYCGSKENLTLDHIVPKSRGGKHTWDNLVTACMKCNNKKDNFLLEELGISIPTIPRLTPLHFLTNSANQNSKTWWPYLFKS
jgi:5-methylcytosine-specific restriction endonuclease McrA